MNVRPGCIGFLLFQLHAMIPLLMIEINHANRWDLICIITALGKMLEKFID